MEELPEKIWKYCLAQMDKMTAWIGLIGLICMVLGMHTALALLFVLLIILPQNEFSELFKKWADAIRSLNN